ncbi:hypothetical protein GOBAR_DD22860 [Gossypium barbadense]|nr:hypothetical protein GOBAR_DD22860 [Gossypium barbadense]
MNSSLTAFSVLSIYLASKQPEENPLTEQNPPAASEPSLPDQEPEAGPRITSQSLPVLSASKRQSGGSPAELNINIWPFSRSRSAGTSGTRSRMTAGTRKVSSAPCSRSNSAGESKSRKWPSSPSRAGVHLGRSSPVWQVRRGGSAVKSSDVMARTAEKGSGRKEVTETRRGKIGNSGNNNSNKARVLNLNVPMCIGYKHHLNCRIDNNSATVAGIVTDPNGGSGGNGRTNGPNVGSGSNFFNLRNLFSKKVY